MAQPKILSNQADVGTGPDQLVTHSSLFAAETGRVVQTVHGAIVPSTGSSIIPFNNSVPLVTGGTSFGSAVLATTSVLSHVHIDFSVTVDANNPNEPLVIAVFRDSVCIGSTVSVVVTPGQPSTIALSIDSIPGDTDPHTYMGRIGVTSGGMSWYVNSTSTGNNLGGTLTSAFRLTEYT